MAYLKLGLVTKRGSTFGMTYRYAKCGSNRQSHALGYQRDHQSHGNKYAETPQLLGQTGHPVGHGHECEIQQYLQGQSRYGQCHIVGHKRVPAIKGLLLDHLDIRRIYKMNDVNRLHIIIIILITLLTAQNGHHHLCVDNHENGANAELEMIEHACTLIAKLEEYQAKEETTQCVMEQLDGQCEAGTHCAQQHDSHEHKELLHAGYLISIPSQTTREYFNLLHQCTSCSHQ